MTADPAPTSTDLPCHGCGYDLRAHPPDGLCPECGASVAQSRLVAAVPLRPAWRDSDPRWRRRVLAGVWVLAFLPLVDALKALDWASGVTVPAALEHGGFVRTLRETLLCEQSVFQPLAFCVGVALLFAKERGRRRGRLDWTRRWGVLCCYVVLLLRAAGLFFLVALVCVGIGALFVSMPRHTQPRMTQSLIDWSAGYIRYGPQPLNATAVVLVAFSSVAILLACVPLFDALRSTGSRRVAAALVAPLALFSLVYLAGVGRCCLEFLNVSTANVLELSFYEIYFRPDALVSPVAGPQFYGFVPAPSSVAVIVEVIKWCTVLAIAIRLTAASLSAPRKI